MLTGTLIKIDIFLGFTKKNELFFQLRHDTKEQEGHFRL